MHPYKADEDYPAEAPAVRHRSLSLEARRGGIAVAATLAGLFSIVNTGYAIEETLQIIDVINAPDLPSVTPETIQAEHAQKAEAIRNLEIQGIGEAGLLAATGIVVYMLLPVRRDEQ